MTTITAKPSSTASDPIVVKATPVDPRIVSFGGNTYRLTYYTDGIDQNLSNKDWQGLRQKFIRQMTSLQNEGKRDLSKVKVIAFKLETDRIDIWHHGSLTHKPDTVLRTHEGALRHFLVNIPPLKKSDDDTEKKKATTTPTEPSKPALSTTEEYDRLIKEGKLKEAVINDFEGNYGPDLTNDSLGFYLNTLKNRIPHNLEILTYEGNNCPLIYDEPHLVDWSKGTNSELNLPLVQAMSNNQNNQIYIPFRTPGHFELIVIDKERGEIIGYDPLGHFNDSTDRRDVLSKLQSMARECGFGDYRIISDQFPNGVHQDDSVRCALHVINFILRMVNRASARDIFRLGNDQIDIEKTRQDVLELLRAS